eukprot:Plantae.Rhodophyta-Purpureofilum_apyrenoidigerum.ctg23856.p1 GENE.Plantae.Rhodophyta-Purpureofilum_apyrenoidigerum.ctg23856~~Plantae.Rhodophyta-Purpureofilum_apyrenoidigerum.ctg23856.p1  ORF type:complete len:234 (+),score=58.79 Plantae.Rhodophyta-Purpureofilum_apyrenoidigerum.ctg23856:201-902(+)
MSKLLAGAKCVVSGATGNIGSSAVQGFLKHGVEKVAIIGRNADSLNKVKASKFGSDERVVTVTADIDNEEGALKAAEEVKRLLGEVNHFVSSAGPWLPKMKLSEYNTETFEAGLKSNVKPHFYLLKAFADVVKDSYVIVNGAAMYHIVNVGFVGFAAHCVNGLSKLITADLDGRGVRAHELLIDIRVSDDNGMPTATFGDVFAAIAAGKQAEKSTETIDGNRENVEKLISSVN